MDLSAIARLLDSLNEHQRRVAEIGPGPSAVIGNPGSGKTSALVSRIARLARDGLDPQYVLAMTFTRAAAAELNERLAALGIVGGQIGTMHSLALDMLKAEVSGLIASRTLDESGWKSDQELQRTLGDMRKEKLIPGRGSVDLDGLKRFIGFCKAGGPCPVHGNPFGLNELGYDHVRRLATGFYDATGGLERETLVELYDRAETRRAAARLYDFDDMQLWAWMLMIANPPTLKRWQQRWSVTMVDECQDSSPVQWDIARLLAGGRSRILPARTPELPEVPPTLMVLGDVSQSLYSFRAAVPEWFSDYATTAGVGLFTLPINYRSTPEICWATTRTVDGKTWHLGGEIISYRGAPDSVTKERLKESLQCRVFPGLHEEVTAVLTQATELAGGTADWTRVVVMARLSMFLHLVEIECIRRGIPYEKRAGGAFVDSKEVQDILGYLRVAGGWDPDGKWLRRCVHVPFRYISRVAMDWAAGQRGSDFLGSLQEAPMLSQRQRRAVQELEETIEELERRIKRGSNPGECIRFVLESTEYLAWLREQSGSLTIDASKMAVLEHLQHLASVHTTVTELLSNIDQLSIGVDVGRKKLRREAGNRLVLTTVHRAKGLEWDNVLLCDVAENRFPWNRGFSADEELRLLYVAISRARQTVHVSCSGTPSSHWKMVSKLSVGQTATCVDSTKLHANKASSKTLVGLTDTCGDS